MLTRGNSTVVTVHVLPVSSLPLVTTLYSLLAMIYLALDSYSILKGGYHGYNIKFTFDTVWLILMYRALQNVEVLEAQGS